MRTPNFFLVGAPKCGTTSMYDYLRQHPQIFMSPRKEPFFFATDLDSGSEQDGLIFERSEVEYRRLFAGARDEPVVGEASTCYLNSRVAAPAIRRFAPDARILIMLRDPVEMVQSHHAHSLVAGSENIEDLAEALAAEPDRREGRLIPPGSWYTKSLLYREVCTFSPQVRRFLDAFPREQIHFVIFDDLRADPVGVVRGVYRFLGVDPEFRPTLEVANPHKTVRSRALRSFLRSTFLHRWGKRLIPAAVLHALRPLIQALYHLNWRVEPRRPVDPALLEQLRRDFAPDIAELSRLIGRDLVTRWSGRREERPLPAEAVTAS